MPITQRNLIGEFISAQQGLSNIESVRRQREEQERLRPQQDILRGLGIQSQQLSNQLQQSQIQGQDIQNRQEEEKAKLFDLAQDALKLENVPDDQLGEALAKMKADKERLGEETGVVDEGIEILNTQGIKELRTRVDDILNAADRNGMIKRRKGDDKQKNKKFDQASKIRGEVAKASGEFDKITNSFDRIQSVGDTAAGDLALIFNFMKMLDPGSVVREGEFATAQNTAGVPDRLRNQYNKLISGERLTTRQRRGFRKEAKNQFDSAKRRNDKTIDSFVNLGKRFGLEKEDIIIEKGKPQEGEPLLNIEARGQQLRDQGLTDQQIADQLLKEGF